MLFTDVRPSAGNATCGRGPGKRRRLPGMVALALLVLVLPATAAAQDFPADAQVEHSAQTGKVRFVGMQPGRPDARPQGFSASSSPAAVGRAYLEQHAADLGLDGPSALAVLGSTPGAKGAVSVRYGQTLKGIEVLGGQFAVRFDGERNITSLNGEAVPGGDAFDATPGIDAAAAQRAAIAHVAKSEKARAATLRASTATLKVFDSRILGGPGQDRATLVYATIVSSTRNAERKRLVLVDAHRGHEVATIDETHEAKNRSVCDGQNNPAGLQYPCTAPVLVEGGSIPGSPADVAPAYNFSGATYDFFFTRFGRDSLDGAGFPLKSTVRYCDPNSPCPYGNAFWDGAQMTYGDTFASADDVVGHELAHGLTEFTSGLFYYFQSGAINESLSDVFGEFIDLVTASPDDTAGDRWQIGESLPVGAIRDMEDPTLYSNPDRMGSPYYTLDEGEGDSGGVHSNSGVNNKAAFLITDGGSFNGQTVTALGLERAARLYYVVETQFLTSASDYADLGTALGQACDDLVGTFTFTAAHCVDVRDAVVATEMLTNDGSAPEGPACPIAQSPAYVTLDDLESGTGWTASALSGPSAWQFDSGYATSGDKMLYGADLAATSDSVMTRNAGILIPAGAFLRFRHAYGFEDGTFFEEYYDGGVIDYSTNNGATWNRLAADYTGTLSSAYGNPLGGQEAYGGESNGYVSESVPLTGLAGQTVRFRFRIGSDVDVGDLGWVVDDIGVHTCQATASDGSVRGDFNGDGIGDLAVGAPGEDIGATVDAGVVHVMNGSAAGLTATGSQYWNQNSAGIADAVETGDGFGSTLTAGDFNGDGRDDLAIGAPAEDVGATVDAGVVHVLYGSAAGLTATGSQYWNQNSAGVADAVETDDRFGSALATGKLNNDAFAELVLGVAAEDIGTTPDAGVVQVLPGAASGLTATGSQYWHQNIAGIADSVEPGDGFGGSLAVGDINSTVGQDLAIGAAEEDSGAIVDAGAVHVIYGSATGLTATGSQLLGSELRGHRRRRRVRRPLRQRAGHRQAQQRRVRRARRRRPRRGRRREHRRRRRAGHPRRRRGPDGHRFAVLAPERGRHR